MREYLVEQYASHTRAPELAAPELATSAEYVSGQGTPVRYLQSIFLPDDEICMLLFRATSENAVRAVLEHAGVSFDRIVEAKSHGIGDLLEHAEPKQRRPRRRAV